MDFNLKNPTILKFVDSIIRGLVTTVSLDGYFNFTKEKIATTNYITFKILMSLVQDKIKTDQTTLSSLIDCIKIKTIEDENFELTEVLTNIQKNSDLLFDTLKNNDKKNTIKVKITDEPS